MAFYLMTIILLAVKKVVYHFQSHHMCLKVRKEGRFIVPLPKDPNARSIVESRSQAVKKFLSF